MKPTPEQVMEIVKDYYNGDTPSWIIDERYGWGKHTAFNILDNAGVFNFDTFKEWEHSTI